MEKSKTVTECRACGGKDFVEVLDLGDMPLANNLERTEQTALAAERFPLRLLNCPACSLSFIDTVVSPEILFSHYAYRSAMSQTYKDHCYRMALDLKKRTDAFTSNGGRPLIIDIAGNDGTLLVEFRKVFDAALLNVDPAGNLCNLAMDAGIASAKAFWGVEAAKWILGGGVAEAKSKVFDKAHIITATNVFAHVHDVKDFLNGIAHALHLSGICVIEFPHAVDFFRRAEFDTIYHEHLSYVSLTAFVHAIQGTGLVVYDCEKHPIHGGTLRLYICHAGSYPVTSRVLAMRIEEEMLRDEKTYEVFAERTAARIEKMKERIGRLKGAGRTIAAFAASAKGNVFLNALGEFARDMVFIVDETPEKVGKFSPGTGLEIKSLSDFLASPTDCIINFAWNFHDEITNKLRAKGYTGEIYSAEG